MNRAGAVHHARAGWQWLRGHWVDVLLPPAAFLLAAGVYREFRPPDAVRYQQTQQHYDAGVGAQRAGDTQRAIDELLRAADVVPDSYSLLFAVAIQLDNVGQHARAALLVERALKIDTSTTEEHLHDQYINLLRAWDRIGRYDDLERVLHGVVLKRWPDSPRAAYWDGIVRLRKETSGGDTLGEALASFERALRLDPTNVDARYQYALLLSRLGRWQESEREYRHVLAVAPQFAGTHHGLAQVLRHQGKVDTADEVLAEFARRETAERRVRFLETQSRLGKITRAELLELAQLYEQLDRTRDAATARDAAVAAAAVAKR